jgi:hypothetical protein
MLNFKPVTIEALPEMDSYFRMQNYRTCDFTQGGMIMWADYFKYEYAIWEDTLFVKGFSAIDPSEIAFSIPIGKLDIGASIEILKDYCLQNKLKLMLSAVPEEALAPINAVYPFRSFRLDNWSDYLYEAEKLATLSGKAYNKKRNHVNKFMQTYPDFVFEEINESNLPETISFFQYFNSQYEKKSPLFHNEAKMTEYVLNHYNRFNFIGALIKIDNKVAGFTIGEILADTLYTHIEKASRDYEGIYETLGMNFAKHVIESYPDVKYLNKEDDAGDEGLRKSKLSYHPFSLLARYNLIYCG